LFKIVVTLLATEGRPVGVGTPAKPDGLVIKSWQQQMKSTFTLLVVVVVLSGVACDPARMAHIQVTTDLRQYPTSLEAVQAFTVVTNTVAQLAAARGLTNVTLRENGVSYYTGTNRFTVCVRSPNTNGVCLIDLVDFPSFTRSHLSEEIEMDIRSKLPCLKKANEE
jgi:hypothetical protein